MIGFSKIEKLNVISSHFSFSAIYRLFCLFFSKTFGSYETDVILFDEVNKIEPILEYEYELYQQYKELLKASSGAHLNSKLMDHKNKKMQTILSLMRSWKLKKIDLQGYSEYRRKIICDNKVSVDGTVNYLEDYLIFLNSALIEYDSPVEIKMTILNSLMPESLEAVKLLKEVSAQSQLNYE